LSGSNNTFLSFTWRLKPKGETYTFYSNLNLKTMKKPIYSSTYVKTDTISEYVGKPKKKVLIAPNEWYKPSKEYMDFKNKMKLNPSTYISTLY
jgi:hypothetical protein